MKRVILLIVTLALCLALAGCGAKTAETMKAMEDMDRRRTSIVKTEKGWDVIAQQEELVTFSTDDVKITIDRKKNPGTFSKIIDAVLLGTTEKIMNKDDD